MGYRDDQRTRTAIDVVLKTNAMLFVNLGIESTKTEREQAKIQERKNLRDIMELDRPFIKSLLDEKD